MQKNRGPTLVGAHGYQRFPLSKPAVGKNIALHALSAYRVSTYLISAYPTRSTSFSPNFSNPERWNNVVNFLLLLLLLLLLLK